MDTGKPGNVAHGCEEIPRCVIGIPADAGTAASEETPGTTSKGTPAAASASAFFGHTEREPRIDPEIRPLRVLEGIGVIPHERWVCDATPVLPDQVVQGAGADPAACLVGAVVVARPAVLAQELASRSW